MSLKTVSGAVGTAVTVARVAPIAGSAVSTVVSTISTTATTVGSTLAVSSALPLVLGVGVFGLIVLGGCMVFKDRKGWAGLKYEGSDGSKFSIGFKLE